MRVIKKVIKVGMMVIKGDRDASGDADFDSQKGGGWELVRGAW